MPAPGNDLFANLEEPHDLPARPVPSRLPVGASGKFSYAQVAVVGVVRGLFTYWVPEAYLPRLSAGARVRVPFGNRELDGFFVSWRTPEELAQEGVPFEKVKPILRCLDQDAPKRSNKKSNDAPASENSGAPVAPLLLPEMLEMARWISRQYACSLGSVLGSMLPAGVKRGASSQRLRIARIAKPEAELYAAAEVVFGKAPKQASLLRILLQEKGPMAVPDLLRASRASDAAIKACVVKGWIQIYETLAEGVPGAGNRFQIENDGTLEVLTQAPTLMKSQAEALAAILEPLEAGKHGEFLLQGITGSGKTEVYLGALKRALELGRQGLVLVPEIALTPQTAARFEGRLGRERVAVLHSHLTDGERAEAWRAIREGKISAVVGARSALFAPLDKLGCLIVDEEHEGAFKQETTPRYLGREVARFRAKAANAVLVLGSATPSLESYQSARTPGGLKRLLLPERATGGLLPPVVKVDLREENRETKKYNYISRELVHALGVAIERKEQAILFLNRRGFATVITCPRCGHTEKCLQCDITLTSHKDRDVLTCHYCNYEKKSSELCAHCMMPGLKYWGLGTERVEEQVTQLFPKARIARMDSGTMTKRTAYAETLGAFQKGEVDVLIGTQMIAKGLDFPNVTLVGIILADTALHMPDFRARERTFQLLEQVAGRAGRGPKGGRVIVQTFLPEDPAITFAVKHDYEGFCEHELQDRRRFGYPPYTRLARVIVRGKDVVKTAEVIRQAMQTLKELNPRNDVQWVGPAAAPIAALEGLYRFHFLVKAPDGAALAEIFNGPGAEVLDKLKGVESVVDIDPLAMM